MKHLCAFILMLIGCAKPGIILKSSEHQEFFNRIQSQTNHVIMSDCFGNGILYSAFIMEQGEESRRVNSNSEILNSYRSAINVNVGILYGAQKNWAETYIGGDKIWYDDDVLYLNDDNILSTALTIHELGHVLGFDHDQKDLVKYDYSVPVVASKIARDCMRIEGIR